MSAIIPKFSYPVPSNRNGHAFSSAEDLLSVLGGESSGQYLVGSQGMWHGGIHITDATVTWCALSANTDAEQEYRRQPYLGEQFIRCMADGEIVAYRVCKDYPSTAIPWRDEQLFFSNSFVLVKHVIQPGEDATSGLTFYTLYMNLAPFSAYTQQGSDRERTTKSSQRYYASAADVQALNGGNAAGTLTGNTRVTLGDSIITRPGDNRQFTEVTLTTGTTNAAGVTLAAGTTVWTVSDRGYLTSASSVPVPSWWATCAPPYGTQASGIVHAKARTNWSYYLSSDDVLQNKPEGKLVAGFPVSYEPDNTAQQVSRPADHHTFSLVTLGRDVGQLKKGDRVWVVSDGDSLTPLTTSASGSQPVFGGVVLPSNTVTINAGDCIGHMGFFQLPDENSKRSRYQVHIECLSMDDMAKFITNPGKVGEDAPTYLIYPTDAPLFDKSAQGMTAGSRKTQAPGTLTLSTAPGADAQGNALTSNKDAAFYQRPEGDWLAAASVQKVSQYALGELGFVTLDKAPESFDLIDGIKHPDNMVKGILEQMYKGAQEETRTSHALNEYNYKRLLEQIDSNKDGHYSEEEYLQAIHNVSYRDRLYRIIAKHGSEWYYGKDDPLWKTYLDTLTKDAPQWKTYTEAFIDKVTWMKSVPGMGPEPWHMHPVVFLESIKIKERCRELFSKISKVILQHEGGYVNDPNDRGGETNMGITIATWRAYAPSDLGIEATSSTLKNMTSEQAEIIYYNRYWEPKGFCKLETTKIALMIYDWTITSGRAVTQIRKMLHNEHNESLNVSNRMDDDMVHCINAIEDQGLLLTRIAEIRKDYYRSLTTTNGEPNSQVRFLTGWLNRVDDCLRVSL
ncbi:hypothetical protein FH968_02930 [Buttiauxella sp. B2]|uniref:glycoside hydrolase family 108 protein n=1 Tax=Buttiauxella sp. B2 TaxID=2587812 RepID=UPI001120A982|nr:glycosyl hydrolase 108 family protein [Buttiauxella sp. B2]TNV23012.1 hypothetical protein FH968_02930 [Buttiauxella sp. B2]